MYDASRTRLRTLSVISAPTPARTQTHLAESTKNVLLVGNVARIKRDVVMSLDNVEGRDDVATRGEPFDDVSTEETAATDDEVDVFGLGRHFFCRGNVPVEPPFHIFTST